jgi:hypothetical protein
LSSLLKNNQRPKQLNLHQNAVSPQQNRRSYQSGEALSPSSHHQNYQNHAAMLSNSRPINPPAPPAALLPRATPDEPHSPNELGLNKLSLNILNNNNNDSSNSSWLDSDQFIQPCFFHRRPGQHCAVSTPALPFRHQGIDHQIYFFKDFN